MIRELFRWAQGLGAGALVVLFDYVRGVQAGMAPSLDPGDVVQVAVIGAVVRLLGYLVGKVPVPRA